MLLANGRLQGSGIWKRWFVFNVVGALGIVVQLSALILLTGWLGLNYMFGTALAVEIAVLHNFAWHERWTWADRVRGGSFGRLSRLLRFHLANGLLSLGGNLLLMCLFAGEFGMNYAVANALAIAICSLLNFFAGDRFVFLSRANRSGNAFCSDIALAQLPDKARSRFDLKRVFRGN
jgi:putative flippase GtrA